MSGCRAWWSSLCRLGRSRYGRAMDGGGVADNRDAAPELSRADSASVRTDEPVAVARWVEVRRLAVAGREPVIARDAGRRVTTVWLGKSRFADVGALATATLTLGPDARTFFDLGWGQSSTGQTRQALA